MQNDKLESTKVLPIQDLISKNFKHIENFPIQGITFKDISPMLYNPQIFKQIIQAFALQLSETKFNYLVILESRGFIFGSALGLQINKGLVMIRKKGKLPGQVEQQNFDLEYGKDVFEIQTDAIKQGEKVVIIDDILATGGTAHAASKLVEKIGGKVEAIAFLYEIKGLNGRERLQNHNIITLHSE